MGTWQIRAEFTVLEGRGRIVCDTETGAWDLVSSEGSGEVATEGSLQGSAGASTQQTAAGAEAAS